MLNCHENTAEKHQIQGQSTKNQLIKQFTSFESTGPLPLQPLGVLPKN